ncbi:AsmA family protein [Primorskyibacter sp. S87]|uniref:AsmA family protein n=1 Tax=Primorskyibacter sp. S87 TaxID=3415126 RepID=UPI003C7DD04F
MPRRYLRLLAVFAGLIVVAIVVVTVVLAAPFFSRMRADLVERVLSEQLQHGLKVNGDVRIVLAPISRLHVSQVEIPSEIIAGNTLAQLERLELDVDLMKLVGGTVDLDNLLVHGLQVDLLTQQDGTRNWYQIEQQDTADTKDDDEPENVRQNSILSFLSTRTAQFKQIGLSTVDEKTGFDFTFDLNALDLEQKDGGQTVTLQSDGKVNEQEFTIAGTYPRGAAFTTRAEFGNMVITFDGAPAPGTPDLWQGRFDLDSGQIADLLEVLALAPVLDGQGTIEADLEWGTGPLVVDRFLTDIEFSEGQHLLIEATTEDLITGTNVDINVNARLHPKDAPPPKARALKDLKLTGIEAHIVGDRGNLEFETLFLNTNAFERDLNKVGPISLGHIHRTEEGHLAFDNIHLQAGPEEAPILVAKGALGNVLELKEIDLKGTLTASASLMLGKLGSDVARQYGKAVASFALNDAPGHLTLSEFTARTEGSTLWSLDFNASMTDILGLDGFAMAFDLDVPDTGQFFAPMGIEATEGREFELTFGAKSSQHRLDTKYGLRSGKSRIDLELSGDTNSGVPVVRGRLYSDFIDVADLRLGIQNINRLSKALSEEPPEVQPLVLEDPDTTQTTSENAEDSGPEVQPLVLEDTAKDQKEDGGNAQETAANDAATDDGPEVQPLVLPAEERDAADLLDPDTLLKKTDLELAIEIEKIAGQEGVTRLVSALTARDGKVDLGPVEVTYGGGYFSIHAGSDLVKNPGWVTISGNTSGWRLKTLLDLAGVSLDARGKVRGRFNLSGNLTSAKAFVNSMAGSVTVSMGQGAIASSLLELAGLGVFPWLFSKERQQGYTDIVCIVAPLSINGGKVNSNAVVLETKSVQLVAAGGIDWKGDTIALRAEPRRVGQPLSRSAWPFQVTGRLSSPDFKLLVGGSRPKQREGAMPADRQPCKPDARQLQ